MGCAWGRSSLNDAVELEQATATNAKPKGSPAASADETTGELLLSTHLLS